MNHRGSTQRLVWARVVHTLWVCLVLGAPLTAQQMGLEASVNAERVGLEDILELTLEVRGADAGRAPEPTLPELPSFDVAGVSSSSRVSIVNGQMSATKAYIYSLIPKTEGTFEIGAAELEIGGNVFRSEPVRVEVVTGSVLPQRGRGSLDPFGGFGASPFRRRGRDQPRAVGEDQLAVIAESDQESVFVGQQIRVTYRLFTKVPIMGVQVDEDPPLPGFWVEEVTLPQNLQPQQTTRNGERWFSVALKQRILFPTRAGKLEIPPLTFSMAVRMTTGDPFDSLFARASEPLSRATNSIEIDARALPARGRPTDFSGAVGEFDLEATLNRSEVEAGEAVSLMLTLAGQGNLRSISEPSFDEPAGFRTFEPKVDETLDANSSGFSGSKRWEYVMVPDSGGSKEIGPFRFSYFDPRTGDYRVTSVAALNLDVIGPTSGAPEARATGRSQVRLLRDDVRYLKPIPETFGRSAAPLHRTGWFWLSVLLPLVVNGALLVYRSRRERWRGDERRFRRQKAERMARSRLKQAAALASKGEMEFYDEAALALRTYLADKQGTSASGLTLQAVDDFLADHEVEEPLRQRVARLLTECDQARFTPGRRDAAEMEGMLAQTQAILTDLEKGMAR